MKTIEERASTKYQPIKFADGKSDKDVVLFNIRMEERRVAYIQGATEQKTIDIYKACKWLKEVFEGGGYVQDWQIDDFRKTMEE